MRIYPHQKFVVNNLEVHLDKPVAVEEGDTGFRILMRVIEQDCLGMAINLLTNETIYDRPKKVIK